MKAKYLIVAAAITLFAATAAQASVEINASPTKNMNCSAGVCAPTAKNAVLNATDLANMLASGDVKVVTGSGAVTITVSSSFSWTSTHRLTLDAYYNVSFRAPVVVAGQGAVTIVTNDGGTGGDLIFFEGGKLDFWDTGSSLIINGNAHSLGRTIAQLDRAIAAGSDGFYALSKDYDARHDEFTKHNPVAHKLSGTFEGLGHVISNLSISRPDKRAKCVGFFGKNAGVVRDLSIVNANLASPKAQATGILAGCNSGLIEFSRTDGTVSGDSASIPYGYIGGVVGYNSGSIESSSSTASVTSKSAYQDIGGLVGYNDGGSIDRSHATGTVYLGFGRVDAGGLAGTNHGFITRSYATGSMNGPGDDAGGLVGYSYSGQISECFATGEVNASVMWAGGLAATDLADISNSYATGAIHSDVSEAREGGLIGETGDNNNTATYSIGSVTGAADALISGSVGEIGGDNTNFYWDTNTSGQSQGCGRGDCSGVTAQTDAQLKSGLPSGFDPKIWAQNPTINNGYPYLLANPPPQ